MPAIDPDALRQGLILFLFLVLSLSVHEWAHAWTALKVGDDTALRHGRVTFNPFAHIDPIGTVLLPLMMFFLSAAGSNIGMIGWAKPVPVDPRNFKHPVRDDLLVTLAGPFSNLVLCLIAAIVAGFALRYAPDAAPLFSRFIFLNALLAVFNLVVAVPPLDGSRVLRHLLQMKEETYLQFARYGFLIVIVLINIPQVRWFIGTTTQVVAERFFVLAALIHG